VTTFGAGAMTNSIGEIRDADLVFVIGSNTTEAHPIIAMEMKRAALRGAKLIVADPRRTWLAGFADLHLRLWPGTDVALLSAMAHVILEEGLEDRDFIAAQTEGIDDVRAAVAEWTPERAELVCGVPAAAIRTAARAYATTKRAGIYYTLGITEHTHGTDNVYCLSNLVLLTGHLGVKSAGLNPLRGQNNVQGANDSGASPIYLPGYQRVADPAVRAKFSAAWGAPVPEQPGQNLNEMMHGLRHGELRGMFVMGEDILVSEPDVQGLDEALPKLEALVVVDLFLTETAKRADVVLPAASFAEKDGTFTNSERRVQRVRKAVPPPGEARPDWQIAAALLERAGVAPVVGVATDALTPADVYREMAELCDKFAGIDHARIEAEGGLQWPCPLPDHPGTGTLHEGGPMRGKGLLVPVSYRASIETPDAEWPLLLSTGRTLYHYNVATQTRREGGLVARQSGCFVEVHADDAAALGLHDGGVAEVRTRRGAIEVAVRITERVQRGMVWLPMHFAEARANLLTIDAGDLVTGTAEYKVCAARLTAR
jgi:predicted molibdopterin-dependent oxidoreductase YjgC